MGRTIGLAVLLCFPAALIGGGPPANPPKLTVIQSPTLIVDPTRDPHDGGEAILMLRNDTPAPVKLQLSSGDLVNKASGQPLNVGVTLTPVTDAHGTKPLAEASAPPMSLVWVRATVSQVLEVGEWNADLLNEGVKIGTLKVSRPAQPFAVTLDVPQPDHPALTFTRGGRGLLGFKNDDSVAHTMAWGLMITGRKISAGSGVASRGKYPAPAAVTVPGHGSAQAMFDPPADWFCCWYDRIVKDGTASGEVSVRLLAPNCASEVCAGSPDAPSKTFKVTVNLARYSPGWVDFWGYVAAFILLYLGGLLSLLTNVWLPNYRQRREVADDLDEIERQIAGLSMTLASRLRVLAGQDQHSLKAQIKQLKAWSWDAGDALTNIGASTASLKQRVGILEQLGALRAHFEPLRTNDSPPTLVEVIDNRFEATVELLDGLETNDADMKSAQDNLHEIGKLIGSLRSKNPDFERQLSERAAYLKRELSDGGASRDSACLQPIKDKLPGLFADLQATPAEITNLDPSRYAKWDMVLTKLELVRKYVDWCAAGPRPSAKQDGDKPAEPVAKWVGDRLAALLLIFSLEGLDRARLFIREMHQGIFPEDIAEQIQLRKLQIRKDRYDVRQFAQTQFYLQFDDAAFDTAAAKEEWTCIWDLGHKSDPGMKRNMREYGWSVFHYFPKETDLTVTVNFNLRGREILDPESRKPVEIQRGITVVGQGKPMRRRSKRGDFLVLFIALLPPLAGLIAGAKDEFLKLSLVPAVGAIVALGFFSDQVKSVLMSPKK